MVNGNLFSQAIHPQGSTAPSMECHKWTIHYGTMFGILLGMGIQTTLTRKSRRNLSTCKPFTTLDHSFWSQQNNLCCKTGAFHLPKSTGKIEFQYCITIGFPKKHLKQKKSQLFLHSKLLFHMTGCMDVAETKKLSAHGARTWKAPTRPLPFACIFLATYQELQATAQCPTNLGAGDGAKSVFSHKSGQRVYHCN